MVNCERRTNCTVIEFNACIEHYFTITGTKNKFYIYHGYNPRDDTMVYEHRSLFVYDFLQRIVSSLVFVAIQL